MSKAVKRAQQRLLVKEELIEFKMPQSTETGIMKVMRKDCQKWSTRSISSTPAATDSTKVTDKPSRRDSDKNSVDNDDETTDLDMPTTAQPDGQGEGAEYRSATTPVASKSKANTLTPTSPRAVSTSTATSKAVASPATVKAATIASTTAIKPTATATPVVT